jgi:hypothetical protein
VNGDVLAFEDGMRDAHTTIHQTFDFLWFSLRLKVETTTRRSKFASLGIKMWRGVVEVGGEGVN